MIGRRGGGGSISATHTWQRLSGSSRKSSISMLTSSSAERRRRACLRATMSEVETLKRIMNCAMNATKMQRPRNAMASLVGDFTWELVN